MGDFESSFMGDLESPLLIGDFESSFRGRGLGYSKPAGTCDPGRESWDT